MSLMQLPPVHALQRPAKAETDTLDPSALDKWDYGVRAAGPAQGNEIDIYDVIGEDMWTGGGVTSKMVKAQLDQMTGPVTVNLNSPGGDYYEGLTIYNTLREYKGRVTVKVMGLAGSAASVVMCAGDKNLIATAGLVFVHNCWMGAIGDRNYFAKLIEAMQKFDDLANGVYVARSKQTKDAIAAWMDDETFFTGQEAIDNGFCDDILPSDAVKNDPQLRQDLRPKFALRRADALLARQGITKTERRKMLNQLKDDMSGAVVPQAMQDAGLSDVAEALRSLQSTMKG